MASNDANSKQHTRVAPVDTGGNRVSPAEAAKQDTGNAALGAGIEVKRAVVSAASSGDNQLVAAVSGKKIKVLAVFLVAKEAVDMTFYTAVQASGTALTGTISLTDNEGFVLPPPTNPAMHWMETIVAERLNLYLGAAKQVSGCVLYYEEA